MVDRSLAAQGVKCSVTIQDFQAYSRKLLSATDENEPKIISTAMPVEFLTIDVSGSLQRRKGQTSHFCDDRLVFQTYQGRIV